MAFSSRFSASPNFPINLKKDQNHGNRRITAPDISIGHHQSITQDQDLDVLSIKHMAKVNEVRSIIRQIEDPLERLVIVDHIQRLGIDHHFEEAIESCLSYEYTNRCNGSHGSNDGIYDVALGFRLLREHGYYVSPDVFNYFKDKNGGFRQALSNDMKGMMGLYEASKVSTEGEEILDEANEFSSKSLYASMEYIEKDQARLVRHTLDHPFHMSLPRFNIKHYIKNLKGNNRKTRALQELAKLDFNIVQSMHESEVKAVSKWWRELGLSQELAFARDQPSKWFMWPLAILSNPQFSKYRIELTKPISLIYIIDDIFDVYGTRDELVLFTEAIKRWDASDVDQLPDYMKICFMALYNITNEIAYIVLREHGWNPINSLRKSWTTLCNAFLVESEWFVAGYLPKADEYLRNGIISSGIHVVMDHVFFFLGHGITDQSMHHLDTNPGLISSPATILRLWDDLGTAKDEKQEGYDGSYINCYMKEHDTSSLEATGHAQQMITHAWKKLNEECLAPYPFSPSFAKASLNSARMVKTMYNYDDNHLLPSLEQQINSLLKESIPL